MSVLILPAHLAQSRAMQDYWDRQRENIAGRYDLWDAGAMQNAFAPDRAAIKRARKARSTRIRRKYATSLRYRAWIALRRVL